MKIMTKLIQNMACCLLATMVAFLMSTYIPASAQSPYAMFGDNSKMLEASKETAPSIYRIGNKAKNGVNYYADFDLRKGLATLYDAERNVLRQDSISENAKAIFIAMDPHAENYYHISPYAYCGDNPVRFIDPDGKDYWSTNNINLIIGNIHYRENTTCDPKNIINIITLTY